MEPIRILELYSARGIIHVGANDGEEIPYYRACGVRNILTFEPLEEPFAKLKATYPDVTAFNIGLSNKSEKLVMNVTENDKASSTLKTIDCDDPGKHPVFKDWNMGQWPVVGEETIELYRFDQLQVDLSLYDVLVMDVQGMELQALEGFGDTLKNFNVAVIECSEIPVYKGEAPASEIIEFMQARGFVQKTPTKLHNDILFLKEGI